MHKFSLKALEHLAPEFKTLIKQGDKGLEFRVVMSYYQYAKKYCLNA